MHEPHHMPVEVELAIPDCAGGMTQFSLPDPEANAYILLPTVSEDSTRRNKVAPKGYSPSSSSPVRVQIRESIAIPQGPA